MPLSLFFSFSCYRAHPALPSFPTRRSSDLLGHPPLGDLHHDRGAVRDLERAVRPDHGAVGVAHRERSEEHTSELQSLRHLVCRLLLEKKKNYKHNIPVDGPHAAISTAERTQ